MELSTDGLRMVLHAGAATYDCDGARRMSAQAMLRYCQELADAHISAFGAGEDDLAALGCVFVLSKVSLRIYRPLSLRQPFTAETWARGTDGIVHLRDAAFWNGEGGLAFTCTSGWVLVRPEGHRLLRPKDFPPIPLPTMPQRALQTENFGRIPLPTDMKQAGRLTVQWSDLDFLGHMNNCAYARIIVDMLPPNMQAAPLTGLDIHFKSEALLGETLTVYTARQGEEMIVYADHDRGRCFEARCLYAPAPPPAPGAPACFLP